MTDIELFTLVRTVILAGLAARSITDVPVQQKYQPTQQGVNTPATIYMFKVGDSRYGFLERRDDYDSGTQIMTHSEIQDYESTFQVSCLQPPNGSGRTASDLINIVAAIMQSDVTRDALRLATVAILRVQAVRNPFFVDDKDRFESDASFDFVLTHQQTSVTTIPVLNTVEWGLYRI